MRWSKVACDHPVPMFMMPSSIDKEDSSTQDLGTDSHYSVPYDDSLMPYFDHYQYSDEHGGNNSWVEALQGVFFGGII